MEFSNFMGKLAIKCRSKRLNDFWELIVSKNLTLINKGEAADSDVTKEDVKAILAEGDIEQTAGIYSSSHASLSSLLNVVCSKASEKGKELKDSKVLTDVGDVSSQCDLVFLSGHVSFYEALKLQKPSSIYKGLREGQ
ncbi:hypothetical protein SUGI_0415340 [Cryptomeria japonica]|nr:hypothetical protein SUGI_0415340 [Cryptomeria japonica]